MYIGVWARPEEDVGSLAARGRGGWGPPDVMLEPERFCMNSTHSCALSQLSSPKVTVSITCSLVVLTHPLSTYPTSPQA